MPLRLFVSAIWLLAAHVSAQTAPLQQGASGKATLGPGSGGTGAQGSTTTQPNVTATPANPALQSGTPAPLPPPAPEAAPAPDSQAVTAAPAGTPAVTEVSEPGARPRIRETVPDRDFEADPFFYPGVALVGGGAAALLASLFTGVGAHGIYVALEHDCKNNVCPRSVEHRLDSGKTLSVVSTVLTGAGLVAAGVGAVLLVIAKNRTASEQRPATARLTLTAGPTPLGLGAAGTF